MLEDAIRNVKAKIAEFVNTVNEFIAVRMDYVTMQKSNLFATQEKMSEMQMYEVFTKFLKLREKENRLSECAEKLNGEYNDALHMLCEGLQDENLGNKSDVIIIGLQDVLGKLNKIASIDIFKGVLYVTDNNKPILYDVSRRLSGYSERPLRPQASTPSGRGAWRCVGRGRCQGSSSGSPSR